MSDVEFVIAGYGVILGGIALYAALLLRRLSVARGAARRIAAEADATPPDARR
jgi:hypothetical protein